MNNKNQKRKSKPSGCEYRKAKKAREEENKKLVVHVKLFKRTE